MSKNKEQNQNDNLDNNNGNPIEKAPETTTPTTPNKVDILLGFTLLIVEGKALKLSPQTTNHVFYQLAVKDDERDNGINERYIRMSGNEGGGLHSKEWIKLTDVFSVLDALVDKTIKSAVFKEIFGSSSQNNAGFLAAVLRSPEINLIQQGGNSVFTHVLTNDYANQKVHLMSIE